MVHEQGKYRSITLGPQLSDRKVILGGHRNQTIPLLLLFSHGHDYFEKASMVGRASKMSSQKPMVDDRRCSARLETPHKGSRVTVTFSWPPSWLRPYSRCHKPIEFAPWSHQEEAKVEAAVESINPDPICMKLRLLNRVVL